MNSEVRICEKCCHFFQTGLAISMSGGSIGYCLWIQQDNSTDVKNEYGIVKAKMSAVKKVSDTCSQFLRGIKKKK